MAGEWHWHVLCNKKNITHGVLASATAMGALEEVLFVVVVVVTFACEDEDDDLELLVGEAEAAPPLRRRMP